MKVTLHGQWEKVEGLHSQVKIVLEELWLTDFIQVECSTSEELKKELDIKESPALIIEEESIDFKDMIFEGITPADDELKSMFMSIIGWGKSGGCAPEWCGSGCSC